MKSKGNIIVKLLLSGVMSMLSMLFCIGCGDESKPLPFHAEVVADGTVTWNIVPKNNVYFTEDFWKENIIGGDLGYVNENWNPNDIESEKYVFYPDLPTERSLLITTREQYEHNFIKQIDINFENEMLIVFMLCAVSPSRIVIKDIESEEQLLKVKYSVDFIESLPGYNNAGNPRRTWCAVKMDKLDISIVNFVME